MEKSEEFFEKYPEKLCKGCLHNLVVNSRTGEVIYHCINPKCEYFINNPVQLK